MFVANDAVLTGATTRAPMPAALALGVASAAAIAAFPAVSALFVLPTYPTLLAAVEFDEPGSTRVGRYVLNHPFLMPGGICISLAVALTFAFAPVVVGGSWAPRATSPLLQCWQRGPSFGILRRLVRPKRP